MLSINKKSEDDNYAKASVGVIGATTAGVIGTKTIIGSAILNTIGYAGVGAKAGVVLASLAAGTCAAPVILTAAVGYLAVSGIAQAVKKSK